MTTKVDLDQKKVKDNLKCHQNIKKYDSEYSNGVIINCATTTDKVNEAVMGPGRVLRVLCPDRDPEPRASTNFGGPLKSIRAEHFFFFFKFRVVLSAAVLARLEGWGKVCGCMLAFISRILIV